MWILKEIPFLLQNRSPKERITKPAGRFAGTADSQKIAALVMVNSRKIMELQLHRYMSDTSRADLEKEKLDMHLAL